MKSWFFSGSVVCSLALGAKAQFPPKREGITVVQSKFHENVSISFKEVGFTLSWFQRNPSRVITLHVSPASAKRRQGSSRTRDTSISLLIFSNMKTKTTPSIRQ